MFDALFPSHWSDIQKLMWLKILNGGLATYETVVGNPVTFSAKAAPLKQLKVAFSPVQSGSGDPSPDNVRPISGWSSLHVYDDPLYAGVIEWNQMIQNGNFGDSSNWGAVYGTLSVNANEATYTVTTKGDGSQNRITQGNKTIVEGHKYFATVTVKAPYAARIHFSAYSGQVFDATLPYFDMGTTEANEYTTLDGIITSALSGGASEARISVGSTDKAVGDVYYFKNIFLCDLTQMFGAGNEPATVAEFRELFPLDYYAYNAGTETLVGTVNGMDTRSISISLGSTVYSGYVDVISGVGEITTKAVDMGDLGWVAATSGGARVFYAELVNLGGKVAPTLYGLCSCYATKAGLPYEDGSLIMYGSTAYNFSRVGVRDDACAEMTATEFKNHVTGQTLVFELETPIPISLTPQEVQSLLGENVMWSDANGDLTVEYRSN